MKKKLIAALLAVVCAVCCAFGLAACNLFSRPAGDDTIYAQEIQIAPQDITLNVGEEVTLTAIVMPLNAVNQNVTWSSGNDEVAVVDGNGKVTGVKPGETEIFAQTEECDKFGFSPTGVCHIMISDGLTYAPTPEGYTAYGYYDIGSTITEITVAPQYNGKPVSIIGAIVIPSLKNITIPAGITRIEEGAFDGCPSLENITVSESNANYSSVDGILYNKAKTEIICVPQAVKGEITVADGVTTISYQTFRDCTSVTDVTVPASVTNIEIAEGAFGACTSLETITVSESNANYSSQSGILYNKGKSEILFVPQAVKSVVIPDTVTEIDMGTFYYCSALTSIEIPASVSKITVPSYDQCSSLERITVDSRNEKYISRDGILYGIESYDENLDGVPTPHYYYPIIYVPQAIKGEITILDGVDNIGQKEFQNRTGLAGVTVGNSVTWIDDYAFSGCTSLTNITLPESLTLFGSYVFKNCSSLTSITIPDGVKSVFGAFDGCSSLTNVTIGKDVTSIGYYTFRGCTSLTSITIPDGVNYIDATAFSNCDKLIQKENGISYIDKWAILCDDGVKSAKFRNDTVGIAAHTFSGHAELTALSLPQTLKYINNSAFKRCSSLTSLIIPDSVTVIQSEAFYGCSELESITLPFVGEYTLGSIFGGSSWVPSSLTTVIITGNSVVASAFSGCSGLTNITIPDSVTSIGSYAFSGCSGLTNITVPDSVTAIGNYAFNGCSGLETVNWNAAECTTDGGNLFPGCNNLTTLNIGNKVTEAPFNAFRACSQLETVTVASANAKYHVTDNCLIETESKTLVMGIKNCIIPADGSVTSIGSYAFNGCSWLTSIVIPDSVTSIGSYAFYGCSGLESITLPFVGAGDAASDYTFKYIFGGSNYNNYVPSSLTTVIITGGSVIGDYAFDGCSNITSISIPNSVTQVGRYAFRGCSGLTSITIPDGVTYIGSSTFSGCSSLTSITIPNGVTYIDSSAFSGCSSLQFNEYGNGCYLGNSSNEYMLLVKPVSNDVTSFTINANTKHIWIFDEVFSTCGNVRFEGTKEQWKKIKLYFNVSTGSSNFTVHCTDGDIDCF